MQINIGFIEIKILFIIFFMLTIPGWALISITNYWTRWLVLQRWVIAISLSIAFYPLLFYITRFVFPNLQLGPNKLLAIGFFFLVFIFYKLRRNFRMQFMFDRYEVLTIVLIFITLLTRIIVLSEHPYPAWSDSLHHTLLTELTATNGILPYTLSPYEPVSLDMYHLGLYSITGSLQMLAGIPAYTSLQWISQIFSGLCGIGIFLFLDKFANRKSAIVGLIVAGLISFQPNWYFNWGRFTQLASQTIMVVGICIFWEIIINFPQKNISKLNLFYSIFLASIVNAAIFLLHFRVAIFYLSGLLIIIIYELFKNRKSNHEKRILLFTGLMGLISLVLIIPTILPAIKIFMEKAFSSREMISNSLADMTAYKTPFAAIFTIGVRKWLFFLTIILMVFSIIKKNVVVIGILIWVLLLYGLGYIYLLKIPEIIFTNIGAVLIMLYIPMSLIIGLSYSEVEKLIPYSNTRIFLFSSIIIVGVFFGYIRTKDLDESRFFLTEKDIQAMSWIISNVPENSIFGIKTYYWLSDFPHGIDAGFWIPFFTGRRTNTGSMLFNLGSQEYVGEILKKSELINALESNVFGPDIFNELCKEGIQYLYVKGTVPNFSEQLNFLNYTKMVYENIPVKIYHWDCK